MWGPVESQKGQRDSLGGVALHRRGDVGVDLTGDVGRRVVEALADDFDVDACPECKRRPRVAEAVEG